MLAAVESKQAQHRKGNRRDSMLGDFGRVCVQGSEGGVTIGKAQLRVKSKG